MGFFDKVAFWKRKDSFGDLKNDPLLNAPPGGEQFGQGFNQGFGQQGFDPGQSQGFGQGFQQPNFDQGQGFGQNNQFGQGFSDPYAPASPQGAPSESSYGQSPAPFSQFAQHQQQQLPLSSEGISKDKQLEIISLKLDAIKSELDAMSQRLKRLEMIADGETKKNYGW